MPSLLLGVSLTPEIGEPCFERIFLGIPFQCGASPRKCVWDNKALCKPTYKPLEIEILFSPESLWLVNVHFLSSVLKSVALTQLYSAIIS